MAGKKGMTHYPKDLKLKAIEMFFEERKTYTQITEELELRSEDRAKVWVRQYRREGVEAFNKPGRKKGKSSPRWRDCGWRMPC